MIREGPLVRVEIPIQYLDLMGPTWLIVTPGPFQPRSAIEPEPFFLARFGLVLLVYRISVSVAVWSNVAEFLPGLVLPILRHPVEETKVRHIAPCLVENGRIELPTYSLQSYRSPS